jgi:hypothetical protein
MATQRRYKSEAGRYRLNLPRNIRPPVVDVPPPPAVIEERDRALAADAELSPGALHLGDPLPGRSALARRDAARPAREFSAAFLLIAGGDR